MEKLYLRQKVLLLENGAKNRKITKTFTCNEVLTLLKIL